MHWEPINIYIRISFKRSSTKSTCCSRTGTVTSRIGKNFDQTSIYNFVINLFFIFLNFEFNLNVTITGKLRGTQIIFFDINYNFASYITLSEVNYDSAVFFVFLPKYQVRHQPCIVVRLFLQDQTGVLESPKSGTGKRRPVTLYTTRVVSHVEI